VYGYSCPFKKKKVDKAIPNPPTQLVSIALNMVPHEQKGELMRREEKI